MALSRLQYMQLDRSDKSLSRLGPLSRPSITPWKIHPLGTMVPSYSQIATFVGSVFLLLLFVVFAPTAIAQPLQVFILAGQSNMQGHAQVRTFEHIGMDPATKPMLDEMLNADGSPRVLDRVWISSVGCADHEQIGKLTTGFGASQNGPKIGPEYTFGITMEKYVDGPILIIKTSWGGKSLNTDFRSPSAGPYEFNETQLANFRKQGKDLDAIKAEKQMATGVNYRLMIDHVKHVLSDIKRVVPEYDSSKGYELAGFAWFQGWNDMVDGSTYPQRDMPGGYDAYSHAMAHFIRDVRKDLNVPKLPFVIGVLGVNGPVREYGADQQRYKGIHQNFRDAMAAPASMPEFQGNVSAVLTEKYWDRELSTAKSKENEVKQKPKKLATESKLSPAEERALQEKMRSEELTERERQVIDKGISNLEFHYLGSAKILGGIGKGLAESMANLKQLKLKKINK
ncbi:MAG: sialate O-acetylesterase [Pirellula sp.]